MAADAVEVHRLTEADAALFRDIRLEGLRHDPDAFAGTFETESKQKLCLFADRLATGAVFGAFTGPTLLGTGGFRVQPGPKHAHKGMLWGMYVRPQARGSGIGGKLVEAVLDHASSRVELLQLFVVSDNIAARRLYERLGFTQYGLEKHATKYQGRYLDDVLMVKFLTASPEAPGGDARS